MRGSASLPIKVGRRCRAAVTNRQRAAAALKAKGYHNRFVFSKATGHCDGRVLNLTLADTLVWVWHGYHAE